MTQAAVDRLLVYDSRVTSHKITVGSNRNSLSIRNASNSQKTNDRGPFYPKLLRPDEGRSPAWPEQRRREPARHGRFTRRGGRVRRREGVDGSSRSLLP